MNSILITGINGFLGKHIKDTLNENKKIFGLSKLNSDYNYSLEKSIPNFNSVFELVIHAAGLAHYLPTNQNESELFHKANVIGTQNLLKGLEISGIPKNFVFISTVAVYGETVGNLITECTELKAKDPYGKSKIHAEKLVYNWCKEKNVICTILRLPLIVGSNPPGNLGAMINGIKKGHYFNIGGGKAKKSMVLASDVAKYIISAAKVGGIFNLTDGYHPSILELSSNLSFQLKKNVPINLPYWVAKLFALAGDLLGSRAPINSTKLDKITSDLTFDDSKARIAFAWNPTPVLEGLKIS
jgi:nucleoside-diphosphate-sugar epimerase